MLHFLVAVGNCIGLCNCCFVCCSRQLFLLDDVESQAPRTVATHADSDDDDDDNTNHGGGDQVPLLSTAPPTVTVAVAAVPQLSLPQHLNNKNLVAVRLDSASPSEPGRLTARSARR